MTVEILVAGPLLSVQDRGRPGLRRLGVSAAGPMDAPSAALANALCGNANDAALLEFAGVGGHFTSDTEVHFAVTGGDCDIRVDTRTLAPNETHRLAPGEVLKIGALKAASWGYFAVAGGFDTPPVMGSRSTHLRFGLGGVDGRRLQKGDRLPVGPSQGAAKLLQVATPLPGLQSTDPIRIVPGPQDDSFSSAVMAELTAHPFTITGQRDRMAFVLDGPPLPAVSGHDIISDGTVPGAIQVPGSGKPMVLMAECQTTGGYPKIATVISADLARLAQMPVGSAFRFATVSRTVAETAARGQAKALAALLNGLKPKVVKDLSSEYLLSCDLVGGVFDAEALMHRKAAS